MAAKHGRDEGTCMVSIQNINQSSLQTRVCTTYGQVSSDKVETTKMKNFSHKTSYMHDKGLPTTDETLETTVQNLYCLIPNTYDSLLKT